ncbi:MAG: ComF family protein [Spirochaetaceae bacterium]|nr:ComF family protein [Spirochaetaceae bacterium]
MICKKTIYTGMDAWYALCDECRERLQINESQNTDTISLFPYTGPYKKLLRAYKFSRNLNTANFLAEVLVRHLNARLPEFSESAGQQDLCFVPVPPRPGKIHTSGWDQVEFLARRIEAIKTNKAQRAYEVQRCLRRLKSTSQKTLTRDARLQNLRGKIVCTKKPPRYALLLDDVRTTGATLDACKEALLQAGSERVQAVTLFYD